MLSLCNTCLAFSRPDNIYKFQNDIFKPWEDYASLFSMMADYKNYNSSFPWKNNHSVYAHLSIYHVNA